MHKSTPGAYRNASMRALLLVFSLVGLAAMPDVVSADQRLRVPQDIQPPVYTSAGGPFLLPDGAVFAIQDGEWAAIPLWRPAGCIRADFNLLESFDPAALDCPLLVAGFVRWKDGPVSWEARGLGAVPVWFVRWPELQQATADGTLTIGELASLGSLLKGTADFYHEQNHGFALHPMSHLTLVASGALEDGRSFQLRAVEVGLNLVEVQFVFK